MTSLQLPHTSSNAKSCCTQVSIPKAREIGEVVLGMKYVVVILLVDAPRNRFKHRVEPWTKQTNPAISALLYHIYASKAIILEATLSFGPLLKSRLMFEIILGDLSCILIGEQPQE